MHVFLRVFIFLKYEFRVYLILRNRPNLRKIYTRKLVHLMHIDFHSHRSYYTQKVVADDLDWHA